MDTNLFQRRKFHNLLAANYGQEAKDLRSELHDLVAQHCENPFQTVGKLTERLAMDSHKEAASWVSKELGADGETNSQIMQKARALYEAERSQFDAQSGAVTAHKRLMVQKRRQRQT